jgi:transcriptional regulator
MITSLLLFLTLAAEPTATPKPSVTSEEQIQLLVLQRDELANQKAAADAKISALEATIRRMEGVNKLLDTWNKRNCKVTVNTQTGLVECATLTEKEDKEKK